MTGLLFQKFCQWSNDDLQGQPGKLLLHFCQVRSQKGGQNASGFHLTYHLFWNNDTKCILVIYPWFHPSKLPWTLWCFQLQFFPKGNKISHSFFKFSHFSFFLKKSPNILTNTYKKTPEKKLHEACSTMSFGRIVQNTVSSQYLVAEPWTTSHLSVRFETQKYSGPPFIYF